MPSKTDLVNDIAAAAREAKSKARARSLSGVFVDFRTIVEETAARIAGRDGDADELVRVSKRYALPTGPGKFTVARKDQKMFEALYPQTGGDASVGKGEVAMWWLFGGMDGRATKGSHNDVDLNVDGIPVEIKSLANMENVKIGYISSDKETEKVLSILFGVDNLATAFRSDRKKAIMKTDKSFRSGDILDACETAFDFREVLGTKEAKLARKYKIFADIAASVENLFAMTGNQKSPEDMAGSILRKMVLNKLARKPGDGGIIFNILAGSPLDITAYVIDLDRIPSDYGSFDKKVSMEGMALIVNLDAILG